MHRKNLPDPKLLNSSVYEWQQEELMVGLRLNVRGAHILFKGIVHLKMKIMSVITHPHVFPSP